MRVLLFVLASSIVWSPLTDCIVMLANGRAQTEYCVKAGHECTPVAQAQPCCRTGVHAQQTLASPNERTQPQTLVALPTSPAVPFEVSYRLQPKLVVDHALRARSAPLYVLDSVFLI